MSGMVISVLRALARTGTTAPVLSTAIVLFLASFLAAKGILAVFAGASLTPGVVLELGLLNTLPKFQRLVLALAIVGANGYLHYRGGRRNLALSIVPTLLSLAGLGWGSLTAPVALDLEGGLRLGIFGLLAVVALVDQWRVIGHPLGRRARGRAAQEGGMAVMPPVYRGALQAPPPIFPAVAPPGDSASWAPPADPLREPAPGQVAAKEPEEQLLDDLITFFEDREEGDEQASPQGQTPDLDKAMRGLEGETGEMRMTSVAPGLAASSAPIVCPVCNTPNPPSRTVCALCGQPLV